MRTEYGEKHQMEIVQRIVSHEGKFVVQDIRENWQKDIDAISALIDNWDEETEARVSFRPSWLFLLFQSGVGRW